MPLGRPLSPLTLLPVERQPLQPAHLDGGLHQSRKPTPSRLASAARSTRRTPA